MRVQLDEFSQSEYIHVTIFPMKNSAPPKPLYAPLLVINFSQVSSQSRIWSSQLSFSCFLILYKWNQSYVFSVLLLSFKIFSVRLIHIIAHSNNSFIFILFSISLNECTTIYSSFLEKMHICFIFIFWLFQVMLLEHS